MWKLFVCLGLISLNLEAKILELKKSSSSIYIEEKSDWMLGKDLFGMPFIYFSPEKNGQRSNISFSDTAAELELDVKSISQSQVKYQLNKQNWASLVGAKTLSFKPYEMKVNKRGHKIHKIGFNFLHDGRSYLENSYYIECRGKILFSKSLRLHENASHDKDFNDLIGSVDCGDV